jgi:hypothetical protein
MALFPFAAGAAAADEDDVAEDFGWEEGDEAPLDDDCSLARKESKDSTISLGACGWGFGACGAEYERGC